MRLSSPLGILLVGLSAAGLGSPVAGQSSESCWTPHPDPGRQEVVPASRSLRTHSGEGPLAVSLSPSGRLCRVFSLSDPDAPPEQAVGEQPTRPGTAFLLSTFVPGLGQRVQGQGRWVGYAAVEVWAWLQYFSRRKEGRALQREYRDLAWFVARRFSSGVRQDGDWEYYEALTKYAASGAYDDDPLTPGIQPEEDPDTFNGRIWALAQEIYLPGTAEDQTSDQWEQAFQYYASRAYSPALAWDWGSNDLHQSEYVRMIRSSDENLRRSTGMIGVILANHLLSGVDALVSGRLAAAGAEAVSLDFQLVPSPFRSHQLALEVRLPTR